MNGSSKVAEVEAEPGAQESNAGNIDSLTDVIQRNPRDAAGYNTRGVVYPARQYSNAIEDFCHRSNSIRTFRRLHQPGACLSPDQEDDLAMQDFNQAISVNPNDAAAYLGRGNLERAHDNYDAALADLNQAIRLNPEGAQAYHARGLIYQRQGHNAQAIADFNNAIDRDPVRWRSLSGAGAELYCDRPVAEGGRRLRRRAQRRRPQFRRVGQPRPCLREAGNRAKAARLIAAPLRSTPATPRRRQGWRA